MLSQGPAARAPSVRECGGLRRVGFLSPLHQQRVGGILDFLDLDLFVIHSHGGQSARHLLLQGWAQRSARQLCRGTPKRPPGRDLPPQPHPTVPITRRLWDGTNGPAADFSSLHHPQGFALQFYAELQLQCGSAQSGTSPAQGEGRTRQYPEHRAQGKKTNSEESYLHILP